ncbi:MAG: hypothetical protein HRT47_08985 [Candidatus Caenarcaniphilales bacterium]|nr:hypothetical protein [Candidatus Caenarcaniphilales bacterium]
MDSELNSFNLSSELVKRSLGRELNKLASEDKSMSLNFSSKEDDSLKHVSLMLPNITVKEIQERLNSGELDYKFQYLQTKQSQEIKEISIRDFIDKLKDASLFEDEIQVENLEELELESENKKIKFKLDTKDLAYIYIKHDLLSSLKVKLNLAANKEFLTFTTKILEAKKNLIVSKDEVAKLIENIESDSLDHKIVVYYEQEAYFIKLENLIKKVWTCKLLRKSLGLSSSNDSSAFINFSKN